MIAIIQGIAGLGSREEGAVKHVQTTCQNIYSSVEIAGISLCVIDAKSRASERVRPFRCI